MRFAIIISKLDPAAMNDKARFLESFPFKELAEEFDSNRVYELDGKEDNADSVKIYTINDRHVFRENLDKEIDADFFVFATTHKSTAGVKCLSVHVTGNWGKAELGGKEKQLCIAHAAYFREMFLELVKQAKEAGIGYEVSVEQTHHGPFLEKPVLFVEIGCSESEWKDEEAAKVITKTIMNVLKRKIEEKKSVIVLGGGHYNQAANKIMINTEYAVSHICAKFLLGCLDEGMLKQAMQKSIPEPEMVVLDWKGLGQHKQHVKELLEKTGIKSERYKNLKAQHS